MAKLRGARLCSSAGSWRRYRSRRCSSGNTSTARASRRRRGRSHLAGRVCAERRRACSAAGPGGPSAAERSGGRCATAATPRCVHVGCRRRARWRATGRYQLTPVADCVAGRCQHRLTPGMRAMALAPARAVCDCTTRGDGAAPHARSPNAAGAAPATTRSARHVGRVPAFEPREQCPAWSALSPAHLGLTIPPPRRRVQGAPQRGAPSHRSTP